MNGAPLLLCIDQLTNCSLGFRVDPESVGQLAAFYGCSVRAALPGAILEASPGAEVIREQRLRLLSLFFLLDPLTSVHLKTVYFAALLQSPFLFDSQSCFISTLLMHCSAIFAHFSLIFLIW